MEIGTPNSLIIKPGRLSLPQDPAELFGRLGPFVVEVGFGDGRHLAHLGRKYPEWNLLGVDVSLGSVWRAYRRMLREGITNVRLFRGDARFLIRDVLGPESLDRVYVNFPDPWPRKKHFQNRLLQASFFKLLSNRLVPEGALLLTTDHDEYFGFSIEEARKTGFFEITEGQAAQAALETKYALKWQEQKKKIYHAVFKKIASATERGPIIRREDMQHAVLKGTLDSVGPFEKLVHSFEGGHVIVLDGYRDLSGDGLLFKVLVEEANLRQELLVQAWQKPDGVFVSMQPFGDPLATRGVREAVRAVVSWLETQGLEMKESWI